MSMRPTPRLSVEGTREILEELKNGPKDTPERRATLKRAAQWNPQIDRLFWEMDEKLFRESEELEDAETHAEQG